MATLKKKCTSTASPPAEPSRCRPIAHALASDLLALKLLLKLASMAADDEERSRHLEAATRALDEGERRLRELHQAMRLEEGSRDVESVRRTLTESESQIQALRQGLQLLDDVKSRGQ